MGWFLNCPRVGWPQSLQIRRFCNHEGCSFSLCLVQTAGILLINLFIYCSNYCTVSFLLADSYSKARGWIVLLLVRVMWVRAAASSLSCASSSLRYASSASPGSGYLGWTTSSSGPGPSLTMFCREQGPYPPVRWLNRYSSLSNSSEETSAGVRKFSSAVSPNSGCCDGWSALLSRSCGAIFCHQPRPLSSCPRSTVRCCLSGKTDGAVLHSEDLITKGISIMRETHGYWVARWRSG